jgi:predicted transcriptional regulator of viral defense system
MRSEFRWDIIKRFSGNDQNCFSFQDIIDEYPDTDKIYLSKVLSGMIEKGMLIKLSRNIYHIVPFSEDSSSYMPDWHLVAKYLMKGKDYYIAYYSAMQIHGLIIQPSLREFIATNRQVIPSTRKIKDVEFQFVTQKASKFFGFKNTWISQHEKVMVSELEKTIVDAVSKPHLCGGMIEIGKAIYETRDKVNLDKLISYLILYESQVAIKRYLYLCDLLSLEWTAHHESLLRKIGSSFSLLDTTGPDQGRKNSKFRLRINIDTESIRNSIYT